MILNNKGMTLIEILITFVLIGIISASLFNTVSNFNQKQNVESYKEKILTYKNTLTKIIQDDLIINGLVKADSKHQKDDMMDIFTVTLKFRNGNEKELVIKRSLSAGYDEIAESDCASYGNDYFLITYDNIEYPLPNLGEGKSKSCKNQTVYDLRLLTVDITTNNNILSIYIGLYHPEMEKVLPINIICPINAF